MHQLWQSMYNTNISASNFKTGFSLPLFKDTCMRPQSTDHSRLCWMRPHSTDQSCMRTHSTEQSMQSLEFMPRQRVRQESTGVLVGTSAGVSRVSTITLPHSKHTLGSVQQQLLSLVETNVQWTWQCNHVALVGQWGWDWTY